MENDEEIHRLEIKTDRASLEKQALWAGIKPGMRVADIGCGSGITTNYLNQLVQPFGEATGVDYSKDRIFFAKNNYKDKGLKFVCEDIYNDLSYLGLFDFIWVRFLLEYHRSKSFQIIKNLTNLLKPGGIICLIDIDHNCQNHYGLSERLERTIQSLLKYIEKNNDFDPFIGRKLYTYLYDLSIEDISIDISPHTIIAGDINENDAFNWIKKTEIISENSDFKFEEYDGNSKLFIEEYNEYIYNPRRFIYNIIILCRGRKPL